MLTTNEFSVVLRSVFTQLIRSHQKLLIYISDVDNFFSHYFIVKISTYMAYSIIILYLAFLVSK